MAGTRCHHHGSLGEPDVRPWGHGVLLWFEVDDFDAAVQRAAEMGAEIQAVIDRYAGRPEAPDREPVFVIGRGFPARP